MGNRLTEADLRRWRDDIDRALVAQPALEWLLSYGPKRPQESCEYISATVNLNYASACPGARQAAIYLQRAISQEFGRLNEIAIELAGADIETARRAALEQEGE